MHGFAAADGADNRDERYGMCAQLSMRYESQLLLGFASHSYAFGLLSCFRWLRSLSCSCSLCCLYFAALIDKCTLLTLHLAQTRTALALYDDLPLSLLAL